MPATIFCCRCSRKKQYRLLLDGGSTGNYAVELCARCYDLEDQKFVISKETLEDKET